MKRVSVVIPNWNGMHLLEKHLPSVIRAVDDAEIIVVDDGSTDGSVRYLQEKFPDVVLIEKKKHEGFASTVNTGAVKAKGAIIVLLNTDVVPDKKFLDTLLPHFDDSSVFAVGCLDKSVEGNRVVLRGRGEAAWKRGFFEHWRGEVNKTDTAWVSGGSGAFRKSMWDELGGMDPLFNPFYWEDIDLSYRARKAGYRVVFEPKSTVSHYHEEGRIRQTYAPHIVKIIAYRNQFIFTWKNISDAGFLFSHACWTPIRLFQSLLTGDIWMTVGYWAALVRLPKIFVSRMKASSHWKRSDRDLL